VRSLPAVRDPDSPLPAIKSSNAIPQARIKPRRQTAKILANIPYFYYNYSMKKGIYILPNGLTLCGMFFGFFSILSAIKGNYVHAAWAIMIANVFDGLDGWVARLTHSTTRFGIELDSLSDLVAFGVAPAVMIYKWAIAPFNRIGVAVAFFFVACGALRLARYNVQMGSTESKAFTGMPIPGAASVLASLVIFYYEFWTEVPEKNIFVLLLTLSLALFMVSTLRFHGLKEIDFGKRKPFWILVAFVLFIAIVIIHPAIALFVFAMIYLAEGILENIFLFYRTRKLRTAEVKK
jgi:CDP-diacylglycerol--serine O-phosphatidyltransferase